MVAVSSLRFVASSSSLTPSRFQYAGGMSAIPAPRRLVAAASSASYARGISASTRLVASASPALPHARRLSFAREISAYIRRVAQASPDVARPQRFASTALSFSGSCRAAAAAAPGLLARCLPPSQDDLRTEEHGESSTTAGIPRWAPFLSEVSSKTTKSPVVHLLAVLLLSGLKSTAFRGLVEWASVRFKFPEMLTTAILLGATAVVVLFDIAVTGKDVNEVCAYLSTHGPRVQEADLNKSSSTSV